MVHAANIHIAARKVYAVMDLPFSAMAAAVSTSISQNYGAGNGRRILQTIKGAYIFDVIAALVVSVFLWITAPSLIHLISGSTDIVILHNGSAYLYVAGPFMQC